jgi:site-specific recombinase XerD
MNFQKLIEFRYLRDLTLILAVRELGFSASQALEIEANQNLVFTSDQDNVLFLEYSNCRNSIFPESAFLFPTEDGKRYSSDKFLKNVSKLFLQAGVKVPPRHMAQLSPEHLKLILSLKFENQRPVFQLTLATAILGYMALRPGEVANLRREDVQVDSRVMYLRETKSQEPQIVVIHDELLPILGNYVKRLKPGEPLFIRQSKKQWERRDVYRARRWLVNCCVKEFPFIMSAHCCVIKIVQRLFAITLA